MNISKRVLISIIGVGFNLAAAMPSFAADTTVTPSDTQKAAQWEAAKQDRLFLQQMAITDGNPTGAPYDAPAVAKEQVAAKPVAISRSGMEFLRQMAITDGNPTGWPYNNTAEPKEHAAASAYAKLKGATGGAV